MKRIGTGGKICFDGRCNPRNTPACWACPDRPMKVYVGNEGSKRGRALLEEMGYGVLYTAQYLNPDRFLYYCIDNGAYGAWSSGREYDSAPFLRALEKCLDNGKKPDFAVIPDKVAQGMDALE